MLNNLPALRHNFQEIYAASTMPGAIENNLTAWGNRIYNKGCLLGKILCYIDSLIALISPDYPLNRLQEAIVATHALFNATLPSLQQHIRRCEQALMEWSDGVESAKEIFSSEFAFVQEFSYSTRQFTKLCVKNTRFDSLFRPLFPTYDLTKTAFHNKELYEQIGKLNHIHELTAISIGRMPLGLIKKNASGIALEKNEPDVFREWFHRMQWHHHEFPLRSFFKGISALCRFFEIHKKANEQYAKGFVEWNMFKLDHPLFTQADPKHLKWRAQFASGSTIHDSTLKSIITLAEPLNNKLNGFFDKTIAFRIAAPNPCAIVFGHNRAVLNVRKIGRENLQNGLFGFYASNYAYIEPKGRYAIVELLYPIEDPVPLINQIYWLKEQVWTPSHLKLHYLMLNAKGQLVSVKNHVRDIFNFRAIEKLAYDYAKSDLRLYRGLITESHLIRHPHALYFYEALLDGIKGIPYTRKVCDPIRDKIWDGRVIEHGKQLHAQAFEMANGIRRDSEKLARAFEFHKELGAAGRLWPHAFI